MIDAVQIEHLDDTGPPHQLPSHRQSTTVSIPIRRQPNLY